MVLPKKPATQKTKLNRSCSGTRYHWRRHTGSANTYSEVAQPAAARRTMVASKAGQAPAQGATAANARGRGRGLVNSWPIEPAGLDRRVERHQRTRWAAFFDQLWAPMRCSTT